MNLEPYKLNKEGNSDRLAAACCAVMVLFVFCLLAFTLPMVALILSIGVVLIGIVYFVLVRHANKHNG